VRYAEALLDSVPRGAAVIARGDSDLVPLAYFHMIEGRRRDLTLVQPSGLILGNRLFHPLRTTEKDMKTILSRRIAEETEVVVSTHYAETYLAEFSRRDHWLYQVVDRSPGSSGKLIDVPEPLVRFFEESLLQQRPANAWVESLQGELRQKYARLLATRLPRGQAPDAQAARHLDALARDFHGALGLVEGLLSNEGGYDAGRAVGLLEQMRQQMPSDAGKRHQARYFELRAYLRQGRRDELGAIKDLEMAISLWPAQENRAVAPLTDYYFKTGDPVALEALQARLKR